VPRLCGLYSGICLTTEEKAGKNLSQGSRRVPAGGATEENHNFRHVALVSGLTVSAQRVQKNSTYPDAGYPDRLGPCDKHFLAVVVIRLFMA
jgi:hypothetical protein